MSSLDQYIPATTGVLAYVKRSSAERQAAAWNTAGPTVDGRVCVVGPRTNGRYPLIWVAPSE